jgi:hypothetical protein
VRLRTTRGFADTGPLTNLPHGATSIMINRADMARITSLRPVRWFAIAQLPPKRPAKAAKVNQQGLRGSAESAGTAGRVTYVMTLLSSTPPILALSDVLLRVRITWT